MAKPTVVDSGKGKNKDTRECKPSNVPTSVSVRFPTMYNCSSHDSDKGYDDLIKVLAVGAVGTATVVYAGPAVGISLVGKGFVVAGTATMSFTSSAVAGTTANVLMGSALIGSTVQIGLGVSKKSFTGKIVTEKEAKDRIDAGIGNFFMSLGATSLLSYAKANELARKSAKDKWNEYYKKKYGANSDQWLKNSGSDPYSTEGYVTLENRGSTGRDKANDLFESMAMDATRRFPFGGETTVNNLSLSDQRWSGWQKWQTIYRSNEGRNVVIHFVYDPINILFDDFKFK